MRLDKIISLANKNTELRFLAMVRSLRAVDCNLPVWVIPYDDHRFQLPDNCIWWQEKQVTDWLDSCQAHKTMRKYQCLLTSNYQFVDADVIFLRNPQEILSILNGFITSCGHWHNPEHTYTKTSLPYLKGRTTTWQKSIFNTGQFASSAIVYDFDTLKKTAEDPLYKATTLDCIFHEQPGINLLVNLSDIPIVNLTLPPYHMESTWAGDYIDQDYAKYWKIEDVKPYLIHWAGCRMNIDRPIDQLFLKYLTPDEKKRWFEDDKIKFAGQKKWINKMINNLRSIKQAINAVEFK